MRQRGKSGKGERDVLFPSDCPWRIKMISRGFVMLGGMCVDGFLL